ncbi:MAG: hypothetical protein GF310_14890 [candidate division Zixibacteria bacterium]|nr:hypothetical protein [candidate division Zixibacteria bacterium]
MRIMKNSPAKKIIAFNGSPVKESNTDLLTQEIIRGAVEHGFEHEHVYLNDLDILPCQACGESPGEKLCFFEDDLFPYLRKFAQCDIAVISSPVYFDTVSAQTKLLIDRCNCFKPLVGYETGNFEFADLDLRPRLGIIVLVGGEREKFEHALTVVKGFFIWCKVKLFDQIIYAHPYYTKGAVRKDSDILRKAFEIGRKAARSLITK